MQSPPLWLMVLTVFCGPCGERGPRGCRTEDIFVLLLGIILAQLVEMMLKNKDVSGLRKSLALFLS